MGCEKSAGSFLILMLFSSMSGCSFLRVSGREDRPWMALKNPNSLAVVALGLYVVEERNKRAHTHLRFVNVIRGASQGSNYGDSLSYRLVVSAKDGNTLRRYKATVQEQPKKHVKTLTSFAPV